MTKVDLLSFVALVDWGKKIGMHCEACGAVHGVDIFFFEHRVDRMEQGLGRMKHMVDLGTEMKTAGHGRLLKPKPIFRNARMGILDTKPFSNHQT